MMMKRSLLAVTMFASLCCAVTESSSAAASVQFAGYSQIGAPSIKWVNNGTGVPANGTGGMLTNSASTVKFFYADNALASLGNIVANFSFAASAVERPAGQISFSTIRIQPLNSIGTVSFTAVSGSAPGCTYCYSAGANLLSATFANANFIGVDKAGTVRASTDVDYQTVIFTSDLLTFGPLAGAEVVFTLTMIDRALFSSTGKALRSFEANSAGYFASDSAQVVTSVPEPETWGLLIGGFGLTGISLRRRRTVPAV